MAVREAIPQRRIELQAPGEQALCLAPHAALRMWTDAGHLEHRYQSEFAVAWHLTCCPGSGLDL